MVSFLRRCGSGTIAFSCLLSLLSWCPQTPDIEAAKKESTVVVYGTVPPQSMQINQGLEKKYGIRVDYWRADSTNILDRALTEWRAGRPGFDLVEGSRAPQ